MKSKINSRDLGRWERKSEGGKKEGEKVGKEDRRAEGIAPSGTS